MSEWTPCSPSWPTSAAPGCHLATVHQHWPHSSGHRRRHGCHDTPHTPALVHSLPLFLSRLRRLKRHRHCRRDLRELIARSSSRLASSFPIFSTSWLDETSLRWATFREIAVVGFTAVVTPIPTNLTAAPSLSSFFSPSCIRVCLGLGCGLCHTIPALVPPSRGNTATAPLCSPPTSTPHVSRLTGAIRVRRFS